MCGNCNNDRLSRFVDAAVDNYNLFNHIYPHYNIIYYAYVLLLFIYRYGVCKRFGNLSFEYLFLICQPK